MANITQWETDLSYKTDDEIDKIKEALQILQKWELFEKEFGHSMPNLRMIVSNEILRRRVKS